MCACLMLACSRVQAEGFSPAIIQRFFQPFLGGIFFDSDLNVTSRLFTYVMRCLATGANCLPAQGIGAVSEQLASCLPQGAIHTGQACGQDYVKPLSMPMISSCMGSALAHLLLLAQ